MKKINGLILLMVVAFDVLFYHQIAGINVNIFCILLLWFCIVKKPNVWFDKSWIIIAASSLVSSIFVGIYGDVLSVVAFLISVSMLAAFTLDKRSSIWVAVSGVMYTYLRSPFISFKVLRLQLLKWQNQRKNQSFIKAGVAGITFIIILLFFFMYRNSSLLFYNLTQKINLEFISFSLFFFTLNAFLLIITFHKYSPIEKLKLKLDKTAKSIDTVLTYSEEEANKISIEKFAAIILLSSLNALLITVNILDLSYLFNQQLPKGISYSDFIHQGVGMLILSIVLAISIILYFFRKELNFINNKWLNLLAYTWIGQNLFMIFSNASRNSMYVDAYGLTEKRIGVYFYLLLAAIGLLTTLIKVNRKQTNAYLIRSTTTIFFIILLISCTVKWDNLITRHDLSRTDAETNFYYLNSLSFTNIPMMFDYVEKNKTNLNNELAQNNLASFHSKILDFVTSYNENCDWQSIGYLRSKVYNEISQRKINIIYLNHANKPQLKALTYLLYLEEVVVRNSSFYASGEWAKLSKLKRLTLINCNITNLNFICHLNQLEYLDIMGNDVENFAPLCILKNLKELHVSGVDSERLNQLRSMLPQTKVLQ